MGIVEEGREKEGLDGFSEMLLAACSLGSQWLVHSPPLVPDPLTLFLFDSSMISRLSLSPLLWSDLVELAFSFMILSYWALSFLFYALFCPFLKYVLRAPALSP